MGEMLWYQQTYWPYGVSIGSYLCGENMFYRRPVCGWRTEDILNLPAESSIHHCLFHLSHNNIFTATCSSSETRFLYLNGDFSFYLFVFLFFALI